MQQKEEHGSDCQLCLKQEEISSLRTRRKRDLSLQTIYRKDYHILLGDPNQVRLPPRSKNQSSNISFKGKSFLDFSSTYLASFDSKQTQRQERTHGQQNISNPEKMPQNFVSTYNYNHHLLPLGQKQEAYRIADFQFNKIKTPFSQATAYKQHFKDQPKIQQKQKHKTPLPELSTGQIRLFETTQKVAYRGDRSIGRSPAIKPVGNIATLLSSPSLYNSTYQQQFMASRGQQGPSEHQHKNSLDNGRRARKLKNYYF